MSFAPPREEVRRVEDSALLGRPGGEPRVALVFCVHHKPWLMMSTLITTAIQDFDAFDVYVVYHVGDGICAENPSYQAYHRIAAQSGVNPKLSPFDERVREVCRFRQGRVVELEFENDHTLDSGAWYKFIRTGRWRAYDYVVFMGEGTLFTRPNALSSMLRFASTHHVHFMASGHEKRRLPKERFLHYNSWGTDPTPLDRFHDQMIRSVFEVFCRDAEFSRLFEGWSSAFEVETQNHVPDIWGRSEFLYRLRNAAFLRRHHTLVAHADALAARLSVAIPRARSGHGRAPVIHVNRLRRPAEDVVSVVEENGVKFHEVKEPEWFGCATNHLMSRVLLERFSERLERWQLYDVLDLPFSGTALEVLWGFLPAWLGFEKWFVDGWHRVAKNFATYRREDDPEGMASYLNRYYAGRLCVGWEGDYLHIRHLATADARRLRAVLDPRYFMTRGGAPHA